jgi:menaquinone-dependent protoporphyrinogen oxidase
MKAAVVYASKHGSTREIAERIAAVLRLEGIEADAFAAEEPEHLDDYGAVILGSAIYMGRWRPEAWRFVRHHRDRLTATPLWLFSSGPVGKGAEDIAHASAPLRVKRTAERLDAREHVIFGGRAPEGPDAGRIARSMAENMTPEERDARDWDVIESWARGIAAALAAEPART